jgi:2-phospho-L-lactate guanylyltransferase
LIPSWTVVIPVKGSTGKSRLQHPDRAELALAIALDTVAAVCRAKHVRAVVLVTADAEVRRELEGLAADAHLDVVTDPGSGLNPAVTAGLAAADPAHPRAALLGDLPALRPEHLDAALELASAHARSFAADAEGTGTTLIAARAGVALAPAFGSGSAARHAAEGLVPLALPAQSTVRRDVDTADQLRAAAALGLGPRTAELVRGAGDLG